MNKKQYILLSLLLVVVGIVVVLSIYKYNDQTKGITTAQAISQRNDALTNLKIQKALNANDQQAVTNLTADKTTLTTTNTTLCLQIKTAKLVQPLCK
jgi:cell division protein ZapA (FtsZ GTPase activity inhibitor)